MNRTAVRLVILALFSASALEVPAQSSPAAEAPDARKLELARRLVQLSDMSANMTRALRNMTSQIAAQQGESLSQDRRARLNVIEDAQADVVAKVVPQITETMVQGYAREFTEKELTDALTFYESPSGREIVAKTPQLLQGVVIEMARLTPQMRREMGEEICAKVTCTPTERAAYFGPSPSNPAPPNPEKEAPPHGL
jgi:uncharacterized protein